MTEHEAIKEIKKWTSILMSAGSQCVMETAEAQDMAIQALSEIQQYRAIEKELREQYHANVDIKMLMQHFIETIFKGEKHEGFCILTNEDAKMWDSYRAIGTVEGYERAIESSIENYNLYREYKAKVEQFELIGTIEEFKELKEKNEPKKPIKHGLRENKVMCPHCLNWLEAHSSKVFCCYCGRKINWN